MNKKLISKRFAHRRMLLLIAVFLLGAITTEFFSIYVALIVGLPIIVINFATLEDISCQLNDLKHKEEY